MSSGPVFNIYAACVAVLVLKMAAVAITTVVLRGRTKKFVNPEDAKAFKGAEATADEPNVARAVRALHNDLENIPAFWMLGLLYVSYGPSVGAAQAYFYTFTIARILHSLAYLTGKQPWRTLFYVVGLLANVGLSVQVLRHAFAG